MFLLRIISNIRITLKCQNHPTSCCYIGAKVHQISSYLLIVWWNRRNIRIAPRCRNHPASSCCIRIVPVEGRWSIIFSLCISSSDFLLPTKCLMKPKRYQNDPVVSESPFTMLLYQNYPARGQVVRHILSVYKFIRFQFSARVCLIFIITGA